MAAVITKQEMRDVVWFFTSLKNQFSNMLQDLNEGNIDKIRNIAKTTYLKRPSAVNKLTTQSTYFVSMIGKKFGDPLDDDTLWENLSEAEKVLKELSSQAEKFAATLDEQVKANTVVIRGKPLASEEVIAALVEVDNAYDELEETKATFFAKPTSFMNYDATKECTTKFETLVSTLEKVSQAFPPLDAYTPIENKLREVKDSAQFMADRFSVFEERHHEFPKWSKTYWERFCVDYAKLRGLFIKALHAPKVG